MISFGQRATLAVPKWSALRRWTALRLTANAAFVAVIGIGFAAPAAAVELVETPFFQEKVAAGELPSVDKRVPSNPSIVSLSGDKQIGRHGGEMRMLIGRPRDVRLLVVYGYARLIAYDEDFNLVPDILQDLEVEDGRIFTLHLRPGHKWSDGSPFTSEDFRYWWDDVANNPELSPSGPPVDLRVDGELPLFEVLDETTVRFTWASANPFFLPRLAGASPLFIYRPSKYLRGFHITYTSEAELEEKIGNSRNWASQHNRQDNMYRFDNPKLPTLQPWVNTTSPPATRFIGVRNPYFHRVDTEGRQLPYIDKYILIQAAAALIPAKAGAGEVDLQARSLAFSDFTFLREAQERNNFKTLLWREAKGSHIALFPNLNINDEVWRGIMRDVRFRRALSLSIDRDLVNEALYFGLAISGNNTVLPESSLYREEFMTKWTEYDPDAANALLDEMGLTERNKDDIRLLPDGRPMNIIVETAGESTEQTDILELVKDDWDAIGIKLFSKPTQREIFRNRIFAGETMVAVWTGFENGIPTPDFNPAELAPTSQHSYQWPKWGQYYETSGRSGETPDMPAAIELQNLHKQWLNADSTEGREAAWLKMLEIHANEMFTIGIVTGVMQPIVVKATLRNIPEEGIFNWEPGAQLGIYRPDTFWFDDAS